MNPRNIALAYCKFNSRILYYVSLGLWIPAELLFGRIACSIARTEVNKFFKDE
jgi:hypothetical protein